MGTPSLPQTATLTNTGSVALGISAIAASSGFAESDTCGTNLAVGANCTITVTFSPATLGPASGAITITDNAPGSPHLVNHTAIGAPTPTFAFPTSIDFGNQPVGASSAPQTVTLANASNQPLLVGCILSSRRFARTNNCGGSIAPGASCSINVTFSPALKGLRQGGGERPHYPPAWEPFRCRFSSAISRAGGL